MSSIKEEIYKHWQGILPIVSVPFLENNEVDFNGFVKTLSYIDSTDAFGMVLFGIASEFYKLSDEEKSLLIEIYTKFKSKKKKIISITDHATHIAVKKATLYQDMGIDGLMLLPPFFLSPTKQQIHTHITQIAQEISIPLILQIAPGETGVSYTQEELLEIHKKFSQCIFKIEGSPPPYTLIENLILQAPDIVIYNGYAGIYMPKMLELGCRGIMPGCSFIEVYTQIFKLQRRGAVQDAQLMHDKLSQYIAQWMTHCEYIIAVEKQILVERRVLDTNTCRHPNYILTNNDTKDIQEFLKLFNYT